MTTIFHPDHVHYAIYAQYVKACYNNPDNPPVIEYQQYSTEKWFEDPTPGWFANHIYRIRPNAITRTVTYPEPLSVAPMKEDSFWIVDAGLSEADCCVWYGTSRDFSFLKNGMCFLKKADAQACYAALF